MATLDVGVYGGHKRRPQWKFQDHKQSLMGERPDVYCKAGSTHA